MRVRGIWMEVIDFHHVRVHKLDTYDGGTDWVHSFKVMTHIARRVFAAISRRQTLPHIARFRGEFRCSSCQIFKYARDNKADNYQKQYPAFLYIRCNHKTNSESSVFKPKSQNKLRMKCIEVYRITYL